MAAKVKPIKPDNMITFYTKKGVIADLPTENANLLQQIPKMYTRGYHHYVYEHFDPASDETRYIGRGQIAQKGTHRVFNTKSRSAEHSRWLEQWSENGGIPVRILKYFFNTEEAKKWENGLIALLNPKYNRSSNRGGRKCKAEHLEIVSYIKGASKNLGWKTAKIHKHPVIVEAGLTYDQVYGITTGRTFSDIKPSTPPWSEDDL